MSIKDFANLLSYHKNKLWRYVMKVGAPSHMRKMISIVLFACLIGAVGLTVYLASTPPIGEKFTEFYLLGPSGRADGYPVNLTLGESGTVIIGILNHEYADTSYSLTIQLDNDTIATINNIVLSHEMMSEQNFTFTPEKLGNEIKVEFFLYKNGAPEKYRDLHLWITVRLAK